MKVDVVEQRRIPKEQYSLVGYISFCVFLNAQVLKNRVKEWSPTSCVNGTKKV